MSRAWRSFRWFEAGVALSGLAAFATVGPLRDALAVFLGVLLVAASVLFLVPGALFARWFLREHYSGAGLLPAAFVISASLFALLGVPHLLVQSTLEAYLWTAGAVVAGSLLAAALAVALAATGRLRTPDESEGAVPDPGGWLWAPFLALVAVLAWTSQISPPSFQGDIWIYLSWVRGFLGGERLAHVEPFFGDEVGLLRVRINGWLLEQAAFSQVSGVDPVVLVFSYLNPALVVVALLAFYALARTLFGSEKAALFCGCLYALFFLTDMGMSRLSFGGEFVQRLTEDKLATKFLFLPMALGFATNFLRGGERVYLFCFAFVCFAVMAVHPVGLAIIGISMAGFGLVHLAFSWRERGAWIRISSMGFAGLAAVGVPAGFLARLAPGEPLTAVLADSDINSGDPDVLRNMIFVQPGRERILELADGSYIMHPSLILHPAIAAAFLLGLPFLLWRVKRSPAARLLLGTLVLTTLLVYVPPIATFVGDDIVLPGQLWRLAWPIPLAAVLTLGWLGWEATLRVAARLAGLVGDPPARPLARALPLIVPPLLVAVLTAAAVPQALTGIERIQRFGETARSAGLWPVDPIYRWFRDEMSSPTVVLAPDLQSARIPAYSSHTNVVSRRGNLVLSVLPALEERATGQIEVPQGSLDVREFFNGTDLKTAVGILRRNEVDYVMVRSASPLDSTLDGLPGFKPVNEPSELYNVYSVDLQRLDRLIDDPGGFEVWLPSQ